MTTHDSRKLFMRLTKVPSIIEQISTNRFFLFCSMFVRLVNWSLARMESFLHLLYLVLSEKLKLEVIKELMNEMRV